MLNPKALGLAGGVVWGVVTILLTYISVATGYAGQWLQLMATIYPGYEVSLIGGVVGFIYAFIYWFVGLFLIAHLYNRLS